MNNVSLMGRLTDDPDVKYGKNDTAIAKYCLAVDGYEKTNFIPCVAFGPAAEFAGKYLVKGIKIGITGEIDVIKYEDSEGKSRVWTQVTVRKHFFCEKKQDN